MIETPTGKKFYTDYEKGYQQGRAEVINKIHTELITEIALLNATDMTSVNLYTFACRIKQITDQLKESEEV